MNRRYRASYNAARLIHGCIGGLFAKNYKIPEFPWDDEGKPKPHEYTPDEIAKLRAEAEAWAAKLNNKK